MRSMVESQDAVLRSTAWQAWRQVAVAVRSEKESASAAKTLQDRAAELKYAQHAQATAAGHDTRGQGIDGASGLLQDFEAPETSAIRPSYSTVDSV